MKVVHRSNYSEQYFNVTSNLLSNPSTSRNFQIELDPITRLGFAVSVRGKSLTCRKLNSLFTVYDRRMRVGDPKDAVGC